MKRIPFGSIKSRVLFNIVESKDNTKSGIDFNITVKKNPFLNVESIIYKSLENKTINDDLSASRYIDECLKLLSKFNKEDYFNSRKLVESFIGDIKVSKLHQNIDTLIFESISELPNIDKLHESYEFILDYVKNNKKTKITESSKLSNISKYITKEAILKKAVETFNTKLAELTESERELFNILINSDEVKKVSLFEGLREDTNRLLLNQTTHNTNELVQDKIKKSLDKINKMSHTSRKDIIDLYSLNIALKSN